MEIPEGFYVRIAALYGLASEHHIQAGAGVIDEDYRGEIKVCLFNHGEEEFKINVNNLQETDMTKVKDMIQEVLLRVVADSEVLANG